MALPGNQRDIGFSSLVFLGEKLSSHISPCVPQRSDPSTTKKVEHVAKIAPKLRVELVENTAMNLETKCVMKVP